MEKELLLKLLETSDYIVAQMKSQKGKSVDDKKYSHHHSERCKDKKHHHHRDCDDKERTHHHKRKEKLSLTAKNALRVLIEMENTNQRNLAKHLNVTAQSMSETIKKLESLGFLERVNNKINNENIIVLTEKGKEKAIEFNNTINNLTTEIFSKLTKEEKETFLSLLEKIYREEEKS